MNTVRLTMLFLTGLTALATAQVSHKAIDQDPVFTRVLLRRIHYPVRAEQTGVYARVYAQFTVDHRGHIQHVASLFPGKTRNEFEDAVLTGLKHLPPLNPRYAGRYILPIAFAYINPENSSELLLPPGSTLPSYYVQNYTLLSELQVVGNSRTYTSRNASQPTPLNSPGRTFF